MRHNDYTVMWSLALVFSIMLIGNYNNNCLAYSLGSCD